jgi:hypothetical protein
MFYTKYRSYSLSDNQPPVDCIAPKRFYDECEMIEGPFVQISKEMSQGYVVVHAHRSFDAPGMTFGPVIAEEAGKPRPILWVMNEAGATVAKYDL